MMNPSGTRQIARATFQGLQAAKEQIRPIWASASGLQAKAKGDSGFAIFIIFF